MPRTITAVEHAKEQLEAWTEVRRINPNDLIKGE